MKLLSKKYYLLFIVFMFSALFYSNKLLSRNVPGSAYDFTFKSIDGESLPLSQFNGKPILLFNSASKCGFTSQYTGIQKIHEEYSNKGLVVIGIPSDNFNQEPGNEEEIKKFCMVNFNSGRL